MAAVTIAGMLEIEAEAMASGWTETQLLDLAGKRLGLAIGNHFKKPGTVVGYLGKGHNAGDTLVALRVLRDEFGWDIATRDAFPAASHSPLTAMKYAELGGGNALDGMPVWRELKGPLLLLDGLLGTGASGALREPLLALSREMAFLREHAGAKVAAVDLPSGIDPNSGEIFPDTVVADITFMIGCPKVGLLRAQAAAAAGALALVAVEPLFSTVGGELELISPQTSDIGKAPRPFDFHKGMAGRVAILAGSVDYSGAAVLAATGALCGGAGLISLFVPEDAVALISSKCPPEIMIRGWKNPLDLLDFRFDALVTGCGLRELDAASSAGLLELIANSPAPVVIDAEALNLLARKNKIGILTDNHVVTPHPGEFKKLAPDLAGIPREEAARRFTEKTSAVLLLKGSRTIVTQKGQPLFCNSTGSPGMATGGQGDSLAGVIGAMLARGETPLHAACLGAWICGRSAEIALDEPHLSEESLTAHDVLHHLGAAFKDWRTSRR